MTPPATNVNEGRRPLWRKVLPAMRSALATALVALTLGATAAAQAVPTPPATYFGEVVADSGYVPAPGQPVAALIADRNCGQGATMDQMGHVVYVVDVVGEGPGGEDGCGAPGRGVVFEVAGRLMAPLVEWGNAGPHELPLQVMEPPLPLPFVPEVSVAVAEGQLHLSWPEATPGQADLRLTRYEVWRASHPYFEPGLPDCRCVLVADVMSLGYEDEGAAGEESLGNPNLNYYYRVKAFNAAGTSDFSAAVGEFDFALAGGG